MTILYENNNNSDTYDNNMNAIDKVFHHEYSIYSILQYIIPKS